MSYDTNVVSPRNIVNPNLQSLLDTGLVLVLDPNKVGAALATLATPVFSVNHNPAGTTSTTGVMAGLGVLFTPKKTGIVKITITAVGSNNTAGDGVQFQAAYGTGAAPANGAAPTGTAVGSPVKSTVSAAGAVEAMAKTVVILHLSVGTQYWIDVVQAAITGGTATLTGVDVLVEELPTA